MEKEQYEEWHSLETQAIERIHRGNVPWRRGVRRLLQLLVMPSFDPVISWEVCRDVKAASSCFAVRSIWQRRTDSAKMENPVVRLRYPRLLTPTVEVQELPLDVAWVETAITAIKGLSVPIMVEWDALCLDGTSYEVGFDAGSVWSRYHWWEQPPGGWQPLSEWLHRTFEDLEQLAENAPGESSTAKG